MSAVPAVQVRARDVRAPNTKTVTSRGANNFVNSFCVSPVSSLMVANKEGYGTARPAMCERAEGLEDGGVSGVVADDQITPMGGVFAFVVRCKERRRGRNRPVFEMFVDVSNEHAVPCSSWADTSTP